MESALVAEFINSIHLSIQCFKKNDLQAAIQHISFAKDLFPGVIPSGAIPTRSLILHAFDEPIRIINVHFNDAQYSSLCEFCWDLIETICSRSNYTLSEICKLCTVTAFTAYVLLSLT